MKARRLIPENPDLNRDIGRLYTQTGDFAAARVAFNQALALEPKESLTYLYLEAPCEGRGSSRCHRRVLERLQSLSVLG